MIDRILMELYDDYSDGNKESLLEFAKKTFPNDGTEKLFVGCTLILFSRANGFKPRYDCTREKLLDIVLSSKERIGSSNLLAFYLDRVNTRKGINKYFKKIINDENLDKYSDLIIEYLDQFKPKFVDDLYYNDKKLKEYVLNTQEESK